MTFAGLGSPPVIPFAFTLTLVMRPTALLEGCAVALGLVVGLAAFLATIFLAAFAPCLGALRFCFHPSPPVGFQ